MNAVMARERPRTAIRCPRKGILIIEDQVAIRHLLRLAFERSHVPVWDCPDGEAALEAYRQHADQIGAILCDVRLPGRSGPETWQALRAMGAAVPCCFMSGDAGNLSEADLLQLGAHRFFPKPFVLHELVATLRDLVAA